MNMVNIVLWGSVFLCSPSVMASGEDWYSFWSIGISDNQYPTELQATFDTAESLGVDRLEISIDAFGFYWPAKNNGTLRGFVVSGTSDNLSENGAELSINTYLYSYSTMHFFGQEPGGGFFLRGDVGLTKGVVSLDTNIGSISTTSD